MKKLLLIFLFFSSLQTFAQVTGKLIGYVKDKNTQETLIGAAVKLEGTTLGGSTNVDGFFKIENIPTKTYNVTVSYLGYKAQTKFDIIITSGNANSLTFELDPSDETLEEVEVRASPFTKQEETPLSIQSLSAQEIKTFPGANFDAVKVAQSLPGVSSAIGFRNDLIIRGGAPNENVYYLDGVEVPNINHFSTQGSAGGPVGMVNVAFIDEVTLSTSAFNPRYDNPLSGVLQFRQKTGNPERTQGNFRLGASEAALTLEGPLSKDKRLTYIASVRRSYLQFLFKLINLPFLPSYWDFQYKVNYKINKNNEISIIGLGAIDNFEFNPPKIDLANQTDEYIQSRLYIYNQVPKFEQYSSAFGISWKRLINNGYMNTVLSTNVLRNIATKYEGNQEDDPTKMRLNLKSYEWEYKLRFDVNKFVGKLKYSYGFNTTYSRYTNNFFNRIYVPAQNQLLPITFSSEIDFVKLGFFGNASYSFFKDKLNLSFGLRTDLNSFTDTGTNPLRTISPRLALTYSISEKLNFNASIGKYYKIPIYTLLGYRNQAGDLVNRNNEYIGSMHYVAGFEYLVTPSSRITLEGFYKKYDNYPVSIDKGISLANLGGGFGFVGNEAVSSVGLGRSYGLEFSFQQKLTKNFYGILAYTFYYSEYTGFDKSKYIASAWDNRHLLTFTGGYKLPKNWELGLRFRFLGSIPYTPYDVNASLNSYLATGQGVLDYRQLNALRFNTFNAADIRIDKKWNFKKLTLDLFLEIQNFYNANNLTQPDFTYRRDPNNSQNFINQQGESVPINQITPQTADYLILSNSAGASVPTIGVVVEF